MFNLGFSELLILGVLALILIGPKELPEMARVVGRLLNELRRATSDFSSNFLNPKPHFQPHNQAPAVHYPEAPAQEPYAPSDSDHVSLATDSSGGGGVHLDQSGSSIQPGSMGATEASADSSTLAHPPESEAETSAGITPPDDGRPA